MTTFELGIPGGFDVLTSFTFEEALGQPYRSVMLHHRVIVFGLKGDLSGCICSLTVG